jgi:MFS family permease
MTCLRTNPPTIWPIVTVVVSGHFVAAFAALSMPAFYGQLLKESFSGEHWQLAGWYFTLATVAAAIANPWWGRLADRVGKRTSLLRAHLGLALSFWLTSLARTPTEFAMGLIAQGLFGGTFSASNAYLCTVVSKKKLIWLLSVMQCSARCALFLGPFFVGFLVGKTELLNLFAYLALLPFIAAIFLMLLPQSPDSSSEKVNNNALTDSSALPCKTSAFQLYALQFLFSAGTVLSFPFFIMDIQERLHINSVLAGLMFGLPHIMFLLLAFFLTERIYFSNASKALFLGVCLTFFSFLVQGAAPNFVALLIGRLLMGLGMTLSYVSINVLAAATTQSATAGKHYGHLEGANKWGAVVAGTVASLLVPWNGLASPLWSASGLLLILMMLMFWRYRNERFIKWIS